MGRSHLPVELIVEILSYLPFKDLVICSGVSHQFRDIIDTSPSLEYILELGLCGLIDSAQGGHTTAERLFRLRQREASWSALYWQSAPKIPLKQKYIFWELSGGLFAGTYRKPPGLIPAPSLRHRRAFNTIDICQLGSYGIAKAGPRQMALEKLFYDFAIDPGQDLLILLEVPPVIHKVWIMHICSLSSGLTHPRVIEPVIEISVAYEAWEDNGIDPTEIQILGRMILFSQRRGPAGSLSVHDWTTGAHIFQLNPVLGDWCGTLLSETELLVSQRSSFRSPPALELYQLHDPWAAPRIKFKLPFPDRTHDWQSEYCYSPASFSPMAESQGRSDTLPFTFAPTPHLLAFRFKSTRPMGRPLDMFLLVDQLRKYVHLGDEVPWEIWGPDTTRIFKGVLPSQWRRNIHGFRALIPQYNTVLDFNSYLWTAGDPGVVSQSSRISIEYSHGRGFSIVSSLPYREMIPSQPFGGDNVMLSDDIVCIEMDSHDRGMTKSLQVLSF